MRALYLITIFAVANAIQIRQCSNPNAICSDVPPNVAMSCGPTTQEVTVTVAADKSCTAVYRGEIPPLPTSTSGLTAQGNNTPAGPTPPPTPAPASAKVHNLAPYEEGLCANTNATHAPLYVVCDAIPATATDTEVTIAQYASKGQGTTLPLALAIPLGCAISVNTLYGLRLGRK